MKLLIVESPSKARTISKYLGKEFKVLASVGHVRDLPKSNKKAVDIEAGFVPHYEIVAKKEPVIDEIRGAAAKADEILIATDPDREGEAIAWHIAELLSNKTLGGKVAPSKVSRITYQEVTKEAVEEALKHPRPIDQNLREAQEARRVLDRLVGYDLSGLVWKKVRYGLSAGRVQSPALRIIMEREREIRAFKPEAYWVISGLWKTPSKADLALTCVEEPRDRALVDSIISAAKAGEWKVKSVEESQQKRSPRPPFTTSTLQQAASSRLGFSPSRTMGIAQKLYEAGHITYMRTDSTNLGNQALGEIASVIEKQYGAGYLSPRRYATKSKNAQEAHEAVRPTHAAKISAGATDEQKRLYALIWRRTVASQMSDAMIMRTKIIANIAGGEMGELGKVLPTRPSDRAEARENETRGQQDATPFVAEELSRVSQIPDFAANGSRIVFDGWLKADPESAGEEVTLPACKEGDDLALVSIDATGKETQPPARYTEAGLIKELEKRGIGRPSTYASITKTIADRGYVEKEGRSLKPTDTGDVVSSFLEEYFPSYISDSFTAGMEDNLDEIAAGKRGYEKTLQEFYKPFRADVAAKEKLAKATDLGDADPRFKCPKCGSPMKIKLGRGGKFLSCSRYPECEGALTIEGHEYKKDEPIGNDPNTGLPIYVLNGRFGPYVQLGEEVKRQKAKSKIDKTETAKEKVKAKKASIPKEIDPSKVTVEQALKYLSLPRTLGLNPKNGKEVTASRGRFGPYVVCDGDFRSVKPPLDIYEITLEQALGLLAQEKKPGRGLARKTASDVK